MAPCLTYSCSQLSDWLHQSKVIAGFHLELPVCNKCLNCKTVHFNAGLVENCNSLETSSVETLIDLHI